MKDEEKNSGNELRISESHVRTAVALLLLVIGFLCVVSYHWGKKKAYEEFVDTLRSDSLGDKVSAALCSVYGSHTIDDSDTHDESEMLAEPAAESSLTQEGAGLALQEPAAQQEQEDVQRYQAELAGFGSAEAARRYVHTLGQRGIQAHVVERASKTARGVHHTWYQVVTSSMAHDELQNIVSRIKARDRLKNVTIVESKEK